MRLPEIFDQPFLFVGNRREPGAAGSFAVVHPATGDTVAAAATASEEQVRAAAAGALGAVAPPPEERARILERTAEHYRRHGDEAADLITAEAGLCHRQARHEVQRAIHGLEAAARQARALSGEDPGAPFRSPEDRPEITLEVIAEPAALSVAITPFNHPLNQVIHKLAPAVAAGTPTVLKPSEKTPLSALYLARVLARCGSPPHLVDVVTGPPELVVGPLVTHPDVEVVSFTGGVEAGKAVARTMAAGGNELVRFIPELGGNAALVVLADADLDRAAEIALGAFDNAGQRCTAIKRLLVEEPVADAFLERFRPRAAALRCGDPWDPATDLGPLIDAAAARRVEARVEDALAAGARLLLGHRRDGAFYPPTVVDRVAPEMELVRLETFGPVAPVVRIASLDEAIAIVRAGRYRLAGAIVTASAAAARRYADAVRVGQLSWNGPPGYRTESAPFGGFGDSGNGEKEGIVCAVRGLRHLRTFYTHRPAGQDP